MTAPAAAGRVLPTLNVDGSRRWIRPKPSDGKFNRRRRIVAWVLMVVFLAIPHLRVGGKPIVLLDLPRRQFTLFGTTFLPTDTLLLMLLVASIVIGIFLATALFGRVWCGWACPQTVYMEFIFRPIERWLEGGYAASRRLDQEGKFFTGRRVLKYAIYLAIAMVLAHTFLAYFVGTERLAVWVRRSPYEHPTSFAIMALTTAAIFLDFTYLREQVCMVACPYGRLQSVLLDRQSMIVAYDTTRGEPRAKGKSRPDDAGDCIDCGACVQTCPTGIDIRDGLQMECIHCTQCADACDAIMARIGKPPGLIRYSSRELLEGHRRHLLRPRTVLYPAALTLFVGGFLYTLLTRDLADVTLLRGLSAPFTEQPDGRIANQVRVKITNRGAEPRQFRVSLPDDPNATLIAPQNPLPLEPGETATASLFAVLPAEAFHGGERQVTIRVEDGAEFQRDFPYRLVGPDDARVVQDVEREHAAERERGRPREDR